MEQSIYVFIPHVQDALNYDIEFEGQTFKANSNNFFTKDHMGVESQRIAYRCRLYSLSSRTSCRQATYEIRKIIDEQNGYMYAKIHGTDKYLRLLVSLTTKDGLDIATLLREKYGFESFPR